MQLREASEILWGLLDIRSRGIAALQDGPSLPEARRFVDLTEHSPSNAVAYAKARRHFRGRPPNWPRLLAGALFKQAQLELKAKTTTSGIACLAAARLQWSRSQSVTVRGCK